MLTDVETLRIPNRLCLALVALYPAHLLASPIAGGLAGRASARHGGLRGRPGAFAAGWMGGGDVKLMAATALWVGPGWFILTSWW